MDAVQIDDPDAFVASLVKKIAQEMAKTQPAIPLSIRLWNAAQCAEFLCQGQRTFVDKTAKGATFPAPIRVPKANDVSLPVWKAAEVIAWADSWKLRS